MTQSNTDVPAISIIVPVYNTISYLEQCLDSLADQTFTDIQILCIDDGSTDGSNQFLHEYAAKDSRITVICQPNSGVSVARNRGLQAATGKYVMFVDSDDYLALKACAKLYQLAQDNDAQIVVYGGVTFPQAVSTFSEDLKIHDVVYKKSSELALFYEKGSFPLMCNKLYLRELLVSNNISFDQTLTIGEDHAFQFCAFPFAKNIVYCQDSFYHYRIGREGSAIQIIEQEVTNRIYKHLDLVRSVLEFWQKHQLIASWRTELLQWLANFFFNDAIKMDLDDRSAFAVNLHSLLEQFGLSSSRHDLQGSYVQKLDFLLDAAAFATDEWKKLLPIATIVFLPPSTEEDLTRGYQATAGMFAQNIQIICLVDSSTPELNNVIAKLASKDVRAEQLVYKNQDELLISSQDLIQAIKANYVLFASYEDWYNHTVIGQTVSLAKDNQADIVTFGDILNILRVRDLRNKLISQEDAAANKAIAKTWLTPSELGSELLDFASLSFSNKLFSRSLLQNLTTGEHSFYPQQPSSIARALMAAQRIAPMQDVPLMLGIVSSNNQEQVFAQVQESVDSFKQIGHWLLNSDLENVKQYQQALDNTTLNFFLRPIWLLGNGATVLNILPLCASALVQLGDPRLKEEGWYSSDIDFELAVGLIDAWESSANQSSDLTYCYHDVLMNFWSSIRVQTVALAHSKIFLERELKEMEQSITMRAGKAVTLIPRKIRDSLSKKIPNTSKPVSTDS